MGGIEDIDILKDMPTRRDTEEWMMTNALSRGDRVEREKGFGYWFQEVHAYIFIPDPSSSTAADSATKFRKITNGRIKVFYTPGSDWPYAPLKRHDMLCFYNDKGPLTLRGETLEDVVLQTIRKHKLMMVLEKKDCYEIMEAR